MSDSRTYADIAKDIMSKYKRRLGEDFNELDKPAKEALDMELEQLRQQQDAVKELNDQGVPYVTDNAGKASPVNNVSALMKMYPDGLPKAKYGGKLKKMQGGGGLPKYQGTETNTMFLPGYSPQSYAVNTPNNDFTLQSLNEPTGFSLNSTPEINLNSNTSTPNTISNAASEPYNYSKTPSYIGTAAGVVNSLLPMFTDYGKSKVDFTPVDTSELSKSNRYVPDLISLDRERAQARRTADVARSSGRRSARLLSNPSAYLNRVTASDLAVDEALRRSVGDSIQREEVTNTQLKNEASRYNAQLSQSDAARQMQADMFNARLGNQVDMYNAGLDFQDRNKYVSSVQNALNIGQQGASEIGKIDRENAMLRLSNDAYDLYVNPETGQPEFKVKPEYLKMLSALEKTGGNK